MYKKFCVERAKCCKNDFLLKTLLFPWMLLLSQVGWTWSFGLHFHVCKPWNTPWKYPPSLALYKVIFLILWKRISFHWTVLLLFPVQFRPLRFARWWQSPWNRWPRRRIRIRFWTHLPPEKRTWRIIATDLARDTDAIFGEIRFPVGYLTCGSFHCEYCHCLYICRKQSLCWRSRFLALRSGQQRISNTAHAHDNRSATEHRTNSFRVCELRSNRRHQRGWTASCTAMEWGWDPWNDQQNTLVSIYNTAVR